MLPAEEGFLTSPESFRCTVSFEFHNSPGSWGSERQSYLLKVTQRASPGQHGPYFSQNQPIQSRILARGTDWWEVAEEDSSPPPCLF